jgi:mRNA-degrading endonuclease RelE of RelBE toxin-antitoxin system
MTLSPKRTLQRTKRFGRDIKKMPLIIQQDAYKIAQELAMDMFNPQLDIKTLVGLKGIYRIVVANNYRMIFSFDTQNIYLLRIAHRKDIYRNLEL